MERRRLPNALTGAPLGVVREGSFTELARALSQVKPGRHPR
jgi:hypothetical protein